MRARRLLWGSGLLALLVAAAFTQTKVPPLPQEREPPPVEFVCPMDPDIRSKGPGKCSKCGMALEPGIPNLVEYPLEVRASPRILRPGQKAQLTFEIRDPKKNERVRKLQVIHEKLFHLFLIGQDLEFFEHVHPEPRPDGTFRQDTVFPKPGLYRLLSDFYPEGGTPQMIAKTLVVGGPQANGPLAPKLQADLTPKQGANLSVELVTEPPQPLAGKKTLLFLRINPPDGLEPYLGAWGHLLAASDDLIDLIHEHPFLADGGPQVQFNIIFRREAVYRVWVQFQRQGTVNTVAFTVPVSRLR